MASFIEKNFVSPIRTTPWGSIKGPAEYDAPRPEDFAKQELAHEPDALKTNKVDAVVTTDTQAPPSADDLRAFVRSQLAGFKVPTEWAFVPTLPRNATGKLLRRELLGS